jgi:hypothetical protein
MKMDGNLARLPSIPIKSIGEMSYPNADADGSGDFQLEPLPAFLSQPIFSNPPM